MTGCGSGTGAFIREKLIAQGHLVYGIGRKGPDQIIDFSFDTNSVQQKLAEDILDEAAVKFGDMPDALINNAGSMHVSNFEDHHIEWMNDVMRINFGWPFMLSKAFVRQYFIAGGSPSTMKRIINISSMAVEMSMSRAPAYVASKAALESMTRCLAREFASRKMKIMTLGIAPCGIHDTEMEKVLVDGIMDAKGLSLTDAKQSAVAGSPLGRWAEFEEVWPLFDFAVNKATEQCSGEILHMRAAMA